METKVPTTKIITFIVKLITLIALLTLPFLGSSCTQEDRHQKVNTNEYDDNDHNPDQYGYTQPDKSDDWLAKELEYDYIFFQGDKDLPTQLKGKHTLIIPKGKTLYDFFPEKYQWIIKTCNIPYNKKKGNIIPEIRPNDVINLVTKEYWRATKVNADSITYTVCAYYYAND